MTTQTNTDRAKREFAAALAPISSEDRRLARTLVRLLGEGRPVDTERVGAALGRPTAEAAEAVAALPWTYRDDDGRVAGAWGLSVTDLAGTPHRLRVGGRELYAWCALDTLFLPLVLGERAEIESRCPTTGQRITIEVGPDGIGEPSPGGVVVSFLRVEADASAHDAIRSLCHYIHFFASEEAAEQWTAEHEGTFHVPLDDAFELARFWAAHAFEVTEQDGAK